MAMLINTTSQTNSLLCLNFLHTAIDDIFIIPPLFADNGSSDMTVYCPTQCCPVLTLSERPARRRQHRDASQSKQDRRVCGWQGAAGPVISGRGCVLEKRRSRLGDAVVTRGWPPSFRTGTLSFLFGGSGIDALAFSLSCPTHTNHKHVPYSPCQCSTAFGLPPPHSLPRRSSFDGGESLCLCRTTRSISYSRLLGSPDKRVV